MALIHGIDNTSKVIPLLVDASGNIIVSASQLTTTGGKVKLDSSGRVLVDGESPSLLRPEPKSGQYANTNITGGTYFLSAVTVPASQYWRMTGMAVFIGGTVAGVTFYWQVYDGVSNLVFYTQAPPPNSLWVSTFCNILLAPSWQIGLNVVGVTAGDDIYINYFAERVY